MELFRYTTGSGFARVFIGHGGPFELHEGIAQAIREISHDHTLIVRLAESSTHDPSIELFWGQTAKMVCSRVLHDYFPKDIQETQNSTFTIEINYRDLWELSPIVPASFTTLDDAIHAMRSQYSVSCDISRRTGISSVRVKNTTSSECYYPIDL